MDGVLGIDVGTTSAKAVAFTADGTARATGREEYGLATSRPGRAEQDPDEVADATVAAIGAAVREALAAGADRVVLGTPDDEAALAALEERFGIEAAVAEGAVTFHVESGEAFVPRLFAELGVAITSVAVSRPTLDDVFMRYTGTTIRDAQTGGPGDYNRAVMRALAGAKR